jgi:tetratricopeptide (TPR) repeat protein
LTAFEKADNDERAATVLGFMGRMFDTDERYEEALQYYSRASERFEQAGDGMSMTIAHSDLGDMCNELGRYEEALDHYNRTVTAYKEGDSDRLAAVSDLNRPVLAYE